MSFSDQTPQNTSYNFYEAESSRQSENQILSNIGAKRKSAGDATEEILGIFRGKCVIEFNLAITHMFWSNDNNGDFDFNFVSEFLFIVII